MNHTATKLGETEFEGPGIRLSHIHKEKREPFTLQGKLFEIVNFLDENHREEMVRDIRRGMMRIQKSIPSKYFYDARGSQLFEQICMTPEYYPTKTELSILERSGAEIMQFFSRKGGT